MVLILSLPWAKSLNSFGIGISAGIGFVYALVHRSKIQKVDLYFIVPFVLLYVLALASCFYSENMEVAKAKMFLKLPMLLFPFALPLVRDLESKRLYLILTAFIGMVFIVGVASSVHYFMNFDALNKLVLQAKPIPIVGRMYHIQFSVFNALSVFIGIYLYLKFKPQKFAYVFVLLAIANFITLHILAARTGLFSFYATAFILLVAYSVKHKSLLGFGSIALLFLSMFGAYHFSTSFRNRCADTKKDIHTYLEGTYPNHFSNTQRLMAMETGWNLFKENWLVGVGVGDVKAEMLKQYELEESPLLLETRKKPHNQFLESMLQSGVISLVLLLALFVLPIGLANKKMGLLLAFLLLMFFSMQFESLFERQSSLYVFLVFYVLLIGKQEEAKEGAEPM